MSQMPQFAYSSERAAAISRRFQPELPTAPTARPPESARILPLSAATASGIWAATSIWPATSCSSELPAATGIKAEI